MLADRRPGGKAVLCAVLRAGDRPTGVVQMARGPDQPPFGRPDLELADALALAAAGGVASMQQLFGRRQQMLLQSVTSLIRLVSVRDDYGHDHQQRVTDYALMLADELKVSAKDRFYLQLGRRSTTSASSASIRICSPSPAR